MPEEEKESVPLVLVSGLPQEWTMSKLKLYLTEYGKVQDVIFSTKMKGCAQVLFEDQEAADKLLENETVTLDFDEVQVKSALDGKNELLDHEEAIIPIPKEALKCFVCKKENFSSLHSFINHKKGKCHLTAFTLYQTKSTAVLQLLRAESKLAADRSFDVNYMRNRTPGKKTRCVLCQTQLNCPFSTHIESVEHKMVDQYKHQKCCNIEFNKRENYEQHLLTLKHLKAEYEKSKEKKKAPDLDNVRVTMKKAIDTYKQCDADLKELKETYGDLDLKEELPPYDKKPIGLNYIVKKINYYCVCCDKKFFANINLVSPHCRSYSHYSNMTDYLSNLEKLHEKKKKEEALAEQKNKPTTGNKETKKRVRGEDDKGVKTPKKLKKDEEEHEEEEEEEEDNYCPKGSNDDNEDKGEDQEELNDDAHDEQEHDEDDAEMAEEDDGEHGELEEQEEEEEMEAQEETEGPENEEEVAEPEEEELVEPEQEEELGEQEEEDEVVEPEEEEEEELAEPEEEEELVEPEEGEAAAEVEDQEEEVQEKADGEDSDIQEVEEESREGVDGEDSDIEEVAVIEETSDVNPASEDGTEEIEAEEDEVVEVPTPKRAARGRRARGRGRARR